jgi:uncharacterized membrane protein
MGVVLPACGVADPISASCTRRTRVSSGHPDMAPFIKPQNQVARHAFVTWIYIALALGLGVVVPKINLWLFPWLVSPMDEAAISTILSAIASGMITLTGIVFSLVFVIVQYGSSAFSPRITRLFANTRVLNHSLGVFTGTFLYCLMALRTMGIDKTEAVSAFTVWLAFAWLLASIFVLANLIRVFTTLTIKNVLFALGKAGMDSVSELYPPFTSETVIRSEKSNNVSHKEDGGRNEMAIVHKGGTSYVIRYDISALLAIARETDTVIKLPYAIGDSVRESGPIAWIRGESPKVSVEKIYAAIVLGQERDFNHDPKYALRLLVDIAIRALSPAINDPTTAVQALDHIETLLHRLGNAQLKIGEVRDKEGKVRVVSSTPDWEDFLQLALVEIMQYGATSLQVQRRLEAVLVFLERSIPHARVPPVMRLAQQRRGLVFSAFDDETVRNWANIPDREGIGSGKND